MTGVPVHSAAEGRHDRWLVGSPAALSDSSRVVGEANLSHPRPFVFTLVLSLPLAYKYI